MSDPYSDLDKIASEVEEEVREYCRGSQYFNCTEHRCKNSIRVVGCKYDSYKYYNGMVLKVLKYSWLKWCE